MIASLEFMDELFSVGPKGTIHLLGVKLVGFNSENLEKLLITLLFITATLVIAWLVRKLAKRVFSGDRTKIRIAFWTRQGINLGTFLALVIGLASIWFDDPSRLTTAMGLITAGLAFALQKVVTAVAGYLVILRGETFNVGDRIVMGGVRGDVVALGFMQTTIMEMGQPPSVQSAEPAMWVKSRQYTGRLVTVPNSKIFDEPVYNYSRDFEFIWEELTLPLAYRDDREKAEQILLNAAQKQQTALDTIPEKESRELCRRFDVLQVRELEPRVYYQLTDNWLEMTVRFITLAHGVREAKDAMAREILDGLERHGMSVATAGFEVASVPLLRFKAEASEKTSASGLRRGSDTRTSPGATQTESS